MPKHGDSQTCALSLKSPVSSLTCPLCDPLLYQIGWACQYQYTRMNFGLSSAPVSYQKTMQHIFRNMNWKFLLIYIDDIIIFSPTFSAHISHTEKVYEQ